MSSQNKIWGNMEIIQKYNRIIRKFCKFIDRMCDTAYKRRRKWKVFSECRKALKEV
jgi:hypothetical protein